MKIPLSEQIVAVQYALKELEDRKEVRIRHGFVQRHEIDARLKALSAALSTLKKLEPQPRMF